MCLTMKPMQLHGWEARDTVELESPGLSQEARRAAKESGGLYVGTPAALASGDFSPRAARSRQASAHDASVSEARRVACHPWPPRHILRIRRWRAGRADRLFAKKDPPRQQAGISPAVPLRRPNGYLVERDGSASKRTLERALRIAGNTQRLAELLGVRPEDLDRWILGKQLPPHEIFLRALDLAFRGTLPAAPEQSQQRPSSSPDSPPRDLDESP